MVIMSFYGWTPCGSDWLIIHLERTVKEQYVMEDELEDRSLLETRTTRPRQGKWTFWLVYATTVCVGGSSLQFGYNTSCINAPQKKITDFFRSHGNGFTDFEWSVVVAIFAVGGMIGALMGPYLANHFGRKKSMLANNIFALLGAVMMFLSHSANTPGLLVTGRFFIGINSGINTAVAPMYLSEIAPIPLRGALGTLNQFGIVFGILVGFVLGLDEVLGTESGWRYIVGFSVVPAILQVITLPLCPRSPRYLLLKLSEEAAAVYELQVLRGTTDVSEDIAEMRQEQEAEIREEHVGILKIFTKKDLQRPLLIAIVLQIAQQLSGINAVLYYSTSTFNKAQIAHSQYATVAVGVVSLIMTAITVKLVEVCGRRPLMLWGLGGMGVFYVVMTIAFRYEHYKAMGYVAVIATLILVIFFQLGPGPIPWFITAEIFTQGPRSAACSIAATVNWLSNFLVGIAFPSMQTALFPYVFVVFIVLVFLFWLFVYIFVPETKGRSIEEITNEFRNGADNGISRYAAVNQ